MSFINRIADNEISITELVTDPVDTVEQNAGTVRHPRIPTPPDMFRPERKNARGFNFADHDALAPLFDSIEQARNGNWSATPFVNGKTLGGEIQDGIQPGQYPGAYCRVWDTTPGVAVQALAIAADAFGYWHRTRAEHRAEILEPRRGPGRSTPGGVGQPCACSRPASACVTAHDDVREAIDFLRYYAGRCRSLMSRRSGFTWSCR